MLTFLFWNLKSRNAGGLLHSLVRQHGVDVLILAECPMPPGAVLAALNVSGADYFYVQSGCYKLLLFTRFSEQYVRTVEQDARLVAGHDFFLRRVTLPHRPDILLCAVHFPSKLRQQGLDQTAFVTRFADALVTAENSVGHERTVLVGDLNMNPYEDGVVMTTGLHAVMTRRIAMKQSRRVKYQSNPYFYNPMWSHFGEKRAGHAGTYYYVTPKARADFWNIYDQVLVRPALLRYFHDEDVRILWHDPALDRSLLTRDGRPNDEISDHLPILFRLQL